MVSDTLLIRHLPASLTSEEVNGFLKHVGAIRVQIRESQLRKYKCAFAKFKNEQVAREVLLRIHQREVLDSRLIVEFAENDHLDHCENEKKKKTDEENEKSKMRDTFVRNLNNWTAGLNLTLPPPYHFKYRYPAPTAPTILNIANMLSYNVKFYTQVVHLMNKMNLPSPFESTFVLNENDVFNSFLSYILENVEKEEKDETRAPLSADEDSEKESELESDDDGDENTACYSSTAFPRKRASSLRLISKSAKTARLHKSTITVPSKNKNVPIEQVFEKFEGDTGVKKIRVNINTKNSDICRAQDTNPVVDEKDEETKDSDNGATNLEQNTEKQSVRETDATAQDGGTITAEELASNKISERDWQMLPFFKNYQPGIPCCRLYVKNLSKHVVVSDLNYIFGRYSKANSNELQSTFNIRLMQEGRMKGQAFITLPNVELAELALKETNGYIVKGKPMVIQFAKKAASQ
ncbi:RNA-binding region-containing protein 3-like [Planococcus citri]|uniref:RNA-binding region-containing protein 3-like n=1 Tax=Planococcus citri TaxID=170843 RepID=UPI0031F963E9